jgi:serine/threonine-protein kinase
MSAPTVFQCPDCHQELTVRPEDSGQDVRCQSCGRPVPAPTRDGAGRPPGLAIPGYEILGTLSNGAMGMVLKARQRSVDRLVAIKVLREQFARDEEYTQRFWREAQIGARLTHANLITTLDAGEAGGRPYLVMEHVEGESLQTHLDRGHVFDEKEAIRVVLGVAEALRHAHRCGLIHRDVKPANVILTRDGGVKLADLGLARPAGDECWALAEAGMAVGTPDYISPEQVRGQVDIDGRSDLYSLGATLYHMVTGRVPFGGATSSEVLRKHVDPRTSYLPPQALNPQLGTSLGAVVGKMMARNRQDRYRDADDLILDLECLIRGDRPLVAERAPEVLAPLAAGEAAPARPDPQADGVPIRGEDDPTWTILLVVPTLLLALALIGTLVVLIAF